MVSCAKFGHHFLEQWQLYGAVVSNCLTIWSLHHPRASPPGLPESGEVLRHSVFPEFGSGGWACPKPAPWNTARLRKFLGLK